ncbi:hypothetical protein [Marinococcus sp. PL1-022]|uniref:hypothetical protein n=1 Tax=Marinococcus sp. PL1-022 TaxID=3095363 RepID=UPI0029C3BD59|nr:hypothetical protein [Marinococcus sp. PL1-022]MDX6152720.1 hypothetical protein [Marinococcus sp. PL1-022]
MAINERKWGIKVNKQPRHKKYADGSGTNSDSFLPSEEKQTCCTPPAGMKERVLQYVFGETSLTQD